MASLVLRSSVTVPSARTRCPLSVALQRNMWPAYVAGAFPGPKSGRTSLVCRASAEQPSGGPPARHAVLHDFCMVIPYGALTVVGGIALFFLNLTNIAGTALVAGATSLAASVLSLQEWKAGGNSKLYTMTSAACAAFVAHTAADSLAALKGAPYWLSLVLAVLSVVAAAFCLYNVAAGGNPPPKGKAKDAPSPPQ